MSKMFTRLSRHKLKDHEILNSVHFNSKKEAVKKPHKLTLETASKLLDAPIEVIKKARTKPIISNSKYPETFKKFEELNGHLTPEKIAKKYSVSLSSLAKILKQKYKKCIKNGKIIDV